VIALLQRHRVVSQFSRSDRFESTPSDIGISALVDVAHRDRSPRLLLG
jgi:hypothetical protein